MTEIKTINASNWTGRDIMIEVLSSTSFRFAGELFVLIEDEPIEGFGDSYTIYSDFYRNCGKVYRFTDGECLASSSGIEREGDDIITVAAQLLANTL